MKQSIWMTGVLVVALSGAAFGANANPPKKIVDPSVLSAARSAEIGRALQRGAVTAHQVPPTRGTKTPVIDDTLFNDYPETKPDTSSGGASRTPVERNQ